MDTHKKNMYMGYSIANSLAYYACQFFSNPIIADNVNGTFIAAGVYCGARQAFSKITSATLTTVLAIGAEFAQMSFLYGTYDPKDIGWYIAGTGLALTIDTLVSEKSTKK